MLDWKRHEFIAKVLEADQVEILEKTIEEYEVYI